MSYSLDQMIGQKLVIGFNGTVPSDPEVSVILQEARAGRIGGVILYGRNIVDAEQVRALNNAFRSIREPFPLFILVDQEGGKVQRLHARNGFRDFPSAREIMELCTPSEALATYTAMGMLLNELGFNFDCAPCVDLDVPGMGGEGSCEVIGGLGRTYGADPETTALFAGTVVEALRSQNVITCLKHFPGHGRAQGDTHRGIVDISSTWSVEELEPYSKLIRKDLADTIMTAHVMHNEIDGENPATLSPVWLKDMLRKELRYKGVIIADDFHMGALQNFYPLEESLIRGVSAGLDLILFSNNPIANQTVEKTGAAEDIPASARTLLPGPQIIGEAISLIEQGVNSGRVDREDIRVSFERIRALKERI